jgi:hypothetical protein
MAQIIVDDVTAATSASVKPLYRSTQVVWYVFYFIEALLLFRFLLRLLAANPGAGFTEFIYTLSYPFIAPFLYVFPATRAGGAVFEWSTLLAMVVYWILAWGIVRLFVMGKPVTQTEANVKLNRQDVA